MSRWINVAVQFCLHLVIHLPEGYILHVLIIMLSFSTGGIAVLGVLLNSGQFIRKLTTGKEIPTIVSVQRP